MDRIRRLVSANRHFAALLLALVLTVKLVVPTGYMLERSHNGIVVTVCSGAGARTMVIDIPGLGSAADHDSSEAAARDQPCAFAGTWAQALGAIDGLLLAAAIAFVMALALRRAPTPAPRAPAYRWPPPQAPPAFL